MKAKICFWILFIVLFCCGCAEENEVPPYRKTSTKAYVMPKSNVEFWKAKIERNRQRDKEQQRRLAEMGWHCITVWECQLKPKVRQRTLESLAFTLNEIFLNDRKVRTYRMPETACAEAAEPDDAIGYGVDKKQLPLDPGGPKGKLEH